jgi:hypothetical protein
VNKLAGGIRFSRNIFNCEQREHSPASNKLIINYKYY